MQTNDAPPGSNSSSPDGRLPGRGSFRLVSTTGWSAGLRPGSRSCAAWRA